ncbi:MAG: CocE/NonD family hydrolase [Gemmatimonadetes bacterium]|nr:CocE/NonD family hydrolase [Gemmatimonadota bacterium]
MRISDSCHRDHLLLAVAAGVFLAGVAACGRGTGSEMSPAALTGDWDYYRMLGVAPSGGFEARRRFGYAHFDGTDVGASWLHRRSGGDLERVSGLRLTGDSLFLDFASGAAMHAQVRGDTIGGLMYRGGQPADRVWLVRRTTPPEYERNYRLWPGEVSDSTFAVTIDPAVPMQARDGTTLMNFVARPMGPGPFGIVMERTPYLRVDTAAGIFWASRGYIYVKQDVRGRGGSDGVLDMNAGQEQDGYDAVEWAAALPGSNGKVGMIGRSNPGLYTWYAAIAQPPHLAAIAPAVATADPIRLVPYIDMVFSPTIVPWLCLTAVHETLSDISNVDVVTAYNHLPVIASDTLSGCPRRQFWNDWFDHQKLDDYWRGLSIEARIGRVKVPVLGIAGWYDDARGTIRNYTALNAVPNHPFQRVVMDAGAHKGIDYVNGDFGSEARIDPRMLQLRWFDHWLKGMDNGVDREPPLDLFIMGQNKWTKENEWPLERTKWTPFYLHSGGSANTSAGDGTLDTIAPAAEPVDTFTYDPGDPTPYLVDARELELNINEDYSAEEAKRSDILTFTTAPLAEDTRIIGPMTATLWAATDAKDTDWNVMFLHVYPDGKAERIQDGVMRARFRTGFDNPTLLTPGRVYKYDIDLWFTGIVIPAGHQLRVAVAAAAFPKYDRNLNTGGDNERDTTFVSAHQRILHDARHPSHVTLPLIPGTGG